MHSVVEIQTDGYSVLNVSLAKGHPAIIGSCKNLHRVDD